MATKTTGRDELLARAAAVIPNGVSSGGRAKFHEVIVRTEGAYVRNAEGKRYIDYLLAYGPIVVLRPLVRLRRPGGGLARGDPQALHGARRTAHGAALVFDEIKTGFRHGLGGYQEICGVTPDLAIFGKALGNGYSIAGVAGRAEILDLLGSA